MKTFQNCVNYVVVFKIDIALIWVILFFCGFSSFAQGLNADIEINGGIVTCPPASTNIGDYNDFGTKRIYVVGDTELDDVVSGGSFSVG